MIRYLLIIIFTIGFVRPMPAAIDIPSDLEQAAILNDAHFAHHIRMDLIQKAEEEVLLSYYLFEKDTYGTLILNEILKAAQRGVKVYLIVDDFFKSVSDEYVSLLRQTKNVEVKIYNEVNPFKLYGNTYRMHDKLMIVDKKYLITGGRNIENAYFGFDNDPLPFLTPTEILSVLINTATGYSVFDFIRHIYSRHLTEYNHNRQFTDRDAFITGKAVTVARNYFAKRFLKDRRVKKEHAGLFANDETSFKIYQDSLSCKDSRKKCIRRYTRRLADNFEKRCKKTVYTTYRRCEQLARRVGYQFRKAIKQLESSKERREEILQAQDERIQRLKEKLVEVEAVYFLHKLTDNQSSHLADQEGLNIASQILSEIENANSRIWYQTPYFIPTKELYHSFAGALEVEEMDFKILTNSLFSTDVNLVHAAYTRHRKPIVESGIELHEYGMEKILHSKTAIIDDDTTIIGSYNLDPRSQNLNSEVGVLIKSKEINQRVAEMMEEDFSLSQKIENTSMGANEFRSDRPILQQVDFLQNKGIMFFLPIIESQL